MIKQNNNLRKDVNELSAFSSPEVEPKLVVIIAGSEGRGKTHLACTMNSVNPVYLIDTEFRAQIVTSKFKNVKFITAKNYIELSRAVDFIITTQDEGTIVIDSGSDLQYFSELEYLKNTHKERVGLPYNWVEVWKLANNIINKIKFSKRFHLVVTSRMKDEYVNDKCTGKKIPRIYSTLPYKADVMLTFDETSKGSLLVNKNGFNNRLEFNINSQESLSKILTKLSGNTYLFNNANSRKNNSINKINLGELKYDTINQ